MRSTGCPHPDKNETLVTAMRLHPTLLSVALVAAYPVGEAAALQVAPSLMGVLSRPGEDPVIKVVDTSNPSDNPISFFASTNASPDSGFYGNLPLGDTRVRVVVGANTDPVTSSLSYTAQVTNDGTTDIPLAFGFHIDRGRVGVFAPSGGGSEPGQSSFFGMASLISEISWNGQTLWSVEISVKNDDSNGPEKTIIREGAASDFSFDATAADDQVFYDAYTGNLGLGLLRAGESGVLSYDILAYAFYESSSEQSCYGYGCAVVGNTDPFHLGDAPFTPGEGYRAGIQPIPEPQTWAMLAAGLGLLGWQVRRRSLH